MIIHPRPPAGKGVPLYTLLFPLDSYDFYPHIFR